MVKLLHSRTAVFSAPITALSEVEAIPNTTG